MALKNNKNFIKLFAVTAMTVMALASMPYATTVSHAATNPSVTLGGKIVLSQEQPYYFNGEDGTLGQAKAEDPDNEANAIWDSEKGILTLNGFELTLPETCNVTNAIAFNNSDALTSVSIELAEDSENLILNETKDSSNANGFGIYSPLSLYIKGDGCLGIDSDSDSIYVKNGISLSNDAFLILSSKNRGIVNDSEGKVIVAKSKLYADTYKDCIYSAGSIYLKSGSEVDLNSDSMLCLNTMKAVIRLTKATMNSTLGVINDNAEISVMNSIITDKDGNKLFKAGIIAPQANSADEEARNRELIEEIIRKNQERMEAEAAAKAESEIEVEPSTPVSEEASSEEETTPSTPQVDDATLDNIEGPSATPTPMSESDIEVEPSTPAATPADVAPASEPVATPIDVTTDSVGDVANYTTNVTGATTKTATFVPKKNYTPLILIMGIGTFAMITILLISLKKTSKEDM